MEDRKYLRITCVVCGTVLFIVYAVTRANGVLTGAAGALIGAGIDVLGERIANRKESAS